MKKIPIAFGSIALSKFAVALRGGICLLLLSSPCFAGTIRGTVSNAETGSRLPGADVEIRELGRSTSADNTGNFELADVPAGTYTLATRFIGYTAETTSVNVPATGTVRTDVTLTSGSLEQLEAFEVKGYREGRELALQQKRSAINLKDIISADTIGNLPDENIADAVARLPGVAIDLENGEGRFVSIRGISPELNNVTINGNNIASPSVGGRSGRATPLDVIGSSQVNSLEVVKAPTPDMDAQGLGGTVNLVTASGFDKDRMFLNGSISGGFNNKTGDNGQENNVERRADVTFGTQFGAKKQFAIALTASAEWRPFQTEEVDFRFDRFFDVDRDADGNFEGEEQLARSIQIAPQFGQRRRLNTSGKLEWRVSENTEIKFEGVYSEFTEWLDEIEDIIAPDDREATFVDANTAFAPNVDEVQLRRFREKAVQEMTNFTLGGKHAWNNFTIEAKVTYAEQESVVNGQNVQFRGRDDEFSIRPGDDPVSSIEGIPIPATLCADGIPGVCEEGEQIPILMKDLFTKSPKFSMGGIENFELDRIPHRRNQDNTDLSDEETWIPQFDARWDTSNLFGTGKSGNLRAGFKYTDRERSVNDTVFRTGNVDATLADIPNAMRSGRVVAGGFDTGLEIDWDPVFEEFFGGTSGLRDLPVDEDAILANSVEDDFEFNEEILAWYAMFEMNFNDRLKILGGVRYEDTDVDMRANQFTEAEFPDDANLSELCDGGFSEEGCVSTALGNTSFDNWLPNFQMRYEIRENLIARFAFTETIGRPDFEDASPIQTFEWEIDDGVLEAESELKNPGLQPFASKNFDITLEYFMDNGMVFAISGFIKEIENPIFDFTFVEENLTVAEAQQIALDRVNSTFEPVGLSPDALIDEMEFEGVANAESGDITGVEVQGFMPFRFLPAPLDGLGIDFNVTLVDSSVDVIGREDIPMPFFDQSDFLANVALFYQRGPLEARVAVRNQSSKLGELGDFPDADLWDADQTFIDAQFSYELSNRAKLFFNARNLTNEGSDSIHGDDEFKPQFFERFGASFQAGLRFNL